MALKEISLFSFTHAFSRECHTRAGTSHMRMRHTYAIVRFASAVPANFAVKLCLKITFIEHVVCLQRLVLVSQKRVNHFF